MYEFKEQYRYIKGEVIDLKLILFHRGDLVEIPYYWYEIVLKKEKKTVGKISIRLGHNFHSYYNGNIGFEIDKEYRGNNYSLIATRMVLPIAEGYKMDYLILTCDDDNAASYKTIERLGAKLIEKATPPDDFFGYYEGMALKRIYKLIIKAGNL